MAEDMDQMTPQQVDKMLRAAELYDNVAQTVTDAIADVKITDVHTHIYPASFGDILLWGIDELLTYHYLVAETMRWSDISYDKYWSMSKREQADLSWKTLFVDHSPVSEACRGVLTTLELLGLDVSSRNLSDYRKFFAEQKVEDYVGLCFEKAGIGSVVMTNDPFDEQERPSWLSGAKLDSRFAAALRIDGLLNSWDTAVPKLREWGYSVALDFGAETITEVRRFLRDWIGRMKAVYMAVSLPPTFAFPEDSQRGKLIAECVLPVAIETGRPFAMMVGVKKLTNPQLKLAGDSVGRASIEVIEHICTAYPDAKFLVTMLARENQHELCVAARKFRNLHVFGCWWFLNNPSLVDETTRMRLELIGLSMTPQHSDARVLDQVVYKWAHSREVIGRVLTEKYIDLGDNGWVVTEEEVRRDVAGLFGGTFRAFTN